MVLGGNLHKPLDFMFSIYYLCIDIKTIVAFSWLKPALWLVQASLFILTSALESVIFALQTGDYGDQPRGLIPPAL